MTPLEIACAYVRRGWAPIPIPFRQKAPRLESWQTLRIGEPELSRYFNGQAGNVGVLLGEPSGQLVDVDLDSAQARITARHLLPDTGAIFGRIGSPESHHLFIARGVRTEKFSFDRQMIVELRSTGTQTVMPGSVHVSGEPIAWETDNGPAEVDSGALREAVARVAAAAAIAARWPTQGRHDAALALAGALRRAGWTADDARTFLEAVVDAAGDEERADRLRVVEDTFSKSGRMTGWTRLAELLDSRKLVDAVRQWLGATGSRVELIGWAAGLAVAKNGAVLNRLANIRLILSEHPDWRRVLALDEFAGDRVRKLAAPPLEGGVAGGLWTDADTVELRDWLEARFGLSLAPERAADGVLLAARLRRYHPVRDWLAGLEWDGTERLSFWLSDFYGAERTAYTSGIGPRVLLAMVARVFSPGCKFDYLPVFEGAQGIGKSTSVRILGCPWTSDTPLDFRGKDRFESLRGKWIVEIPELDSLERAEPERVKSFLSSPVDHYRPSYGREAREFPRQCVLIGTTNSSEYLTDATGNRRYWPIRCAEIELLALEAARDQLFAEAVALYHQGAPWWVDVGSELGQACAIEQAARVVTEPWEPLVAAYLVGREETTAPELLAKALDMRPERMTPSASKKAADILRRLGWVHSPQRARRNGARVRIWLSPRGARLDE